MGVCHLPVAYLDPLAPVDLEGEGRDIASSINVWYVGLHELETEN